MMHGPGARLHAVLEALGPHGVLRHEVPAGTLLLRQDAPVSRVYLIEHGIVKLARCEADGDLSSWGEYQNWDFFWDALPTNVFQQAAVNYSSGIHTWSTFHYDEGEFAWFVTGISYAYGNSTCTY